MSQFDNDFKNLKRLADRDPQQALKKLQNYVENLNGELNLTGFPSNIFSFKGMVKAIAIHIANHSGTSDAFDSHPLLPAQTDNVNLSAINQDRLDLNRVYAYIHRHPHNSFAVRDGDWRPVTAKDAINAINHVHLFFTNKFEPILAKQSNPR